MRQPADRRPQRPGPVADEDSRAYWEALARHELVGQKCTVCGTHRCPPMSSCPACGAPEFQSTTVAGPAVIYSWIVIKRPVGNVSPDELPLVIATVDIGDGCRLLGRFVGPGDPAFDAVVMAQFVDHDGWTELVFASTVEAVR